MGVSFSQIPVLIREPGFYAEFDSSQAGSRASVFPRKALLISQRLATGTVAELQPVRVLSAAEGEGFFGVGSQLAAMISAYKAADPQTELWAVALDDAGGATKGTQTLTFTGPATASGAVSLYVAGTRYSLAVSIDDTAEEVATACAAAIEADSRCPMNAAVGEGESDHIVTLTAKNAGTQGNTVDVRFNMGSSEGFPAGVGCTVAVGVTGATDPDVNNAIAVIDESRYSTIATSLNDATSVAALELALEDRWAPTVKLDGLLVVALAGSLGTVTSYANARNSPYSIVVPLQGSPSASWEVAAAVAALINAKPNVAQPHRGLVIRGMVAPAPADRWTWTERNIALTDGLSSVIATADGKVAISRLITTYQSTAAGVADTSYLDVTTLEILSYLRYDLDVRFSLKFSDFNLAADGAHFSAGLKILTPSGIKAETIAWLFEKENAGLVFGTEEIKDEIIAEIDESDANRVNLQFGPCLMKALHVVAAKIMFR
jgi:phage tail sheath gpL-like